MTPTPRQPEGEAADHRMEVALGIGLRAGVILASLVTLAGGLWLLRTSRPTLLAYRVFSADSGRAAFATLLHHGPVRPDALIALGLFLLIATPVLRVAAMILGFLLEGDRMYAAISALVLAVLALGLVL